MKTRDWGVLAGLAIVVACGTWIACSEAQAEPLEVTYYYLPG